MAIASSRIMRRISETTEATTDTATVAPATVDTTPAIDTTAVVDTTKAAADTTKK